MAAQKLPEGTRLVPKNFQKELAWCLETPRRRWLCGLGVKGEGYKGAECCCGVCLTECTEELLWDKASSRILTPQDLVAWSAEYPAWLKV